MRLFFIFSTSLIFVSCALEKVEEKNQETTVINPKKNEFILFEKEVLKDPSFISDRYPISGEIKFIENQENYSTPKPKQLFSAASSNEIRLHKLGEIRWIYLGLEPSVAWPMTIEFLKENARFGLDSFDADSGTINSMTFKFNNTESKYVFKVERGLQQSSSEIFVSQLKKVNNSWQIVSSKENKLDDLVNVFYEYLSSTGPSTGTSLVALNLNSINKTEVIKDNVTGLSKIKLRINFPRAWAALRRSLMLAGYKILDENRDEGRFYLEYSVNRSLLDRRPNISSVEIIVEELSSKECLISTNLDEENMDLSDEIISQINQSLS